jgi:hypothetical protein
VFDRVEIRNVDTLLLLGLKSTVLVVEVIVTIVLVNVHAEDAYVKTVDLLEQSDSFRSVVDGKGRSDKAHSFALSGHSKMGANNLRNTEAAIAI